MSNISIDTTCQNKLQHLAALSLEVVESLLTDTETPIDIRLNTAFKIVEMCMTETNKELGDIILNTLESNANLIKNNSKELGYLETLLKLNAQNINQHS